MNPHESRDETEQDDAIIGRAFNWSLLTIVTVAAVIGAIVWRPWTFIDQEEVKQPEVALPEVRSEAVETVPDVPFTDITESAGITFIHENGATGEKLLPETMGGGVAFLDFDSDGDQDLLLVNSSVWSDSSTDELPTSALYANDGQGLFQDVTEAAGLKVNCYGMGVAVGDYDSDGDQDVFISTMGSNILLRNDDSTFVDVSQAAKVQGDKDRWSTSCGWLDYDNDGDLDLLVGNYVQWSPEIDLAQDFRLTGIGRAYGPPFSFQGSYPYLYRNEGDGTFTDVSESSCIQVKNLATGVPQSKTLGIAPVDVNHDGWIDIVVANDTVRNQLLINQQDGTFLDEGIASGIAFDASGKARGAMGIDVGCFRNDDCLGIAIGNFANEMSALYVSDGKAVVFTDDAIPTGLGPQTRGDLCFGLLFLDVDLDGRLDLLAANGHLEDDINLVQKSQHYRQPVKLFWNAGMSGETEFVAVSDENVKDLASPLVGRGAAYADIDSDGDLDVIVTQVGGPPALLRNDHVTNQHYLRLKLEGSTCNRDAIGAWVEVQRGERLLRRQVMPTRSYLSQVELPVTIGLGERPSVKQVKVYWPDGSAQVVEDFVLDGLTIVRQQTDE